MKVKRQRSEQVFNLLILFVDILMILASFLIAYFARGANASPIPVIYIWPFEKYFIFALEMIPVWILAFAFAGLYKQNRPKVIEFGQIISGSSLGTMAVVLYVFLQRGDFFSRLVVFYIWVIAIICVSLGRLIVKLIYSNMYLFANKKNLIIIGNSDKLTQEILEQIKNRPSLGYLIKGIVSDQSIELEYEHLGPTSQLDQILEKYAIDEVILTDTDVENDDLFSYLRSCQEKNIVFKAIPAHAQVGARTLEFDEFAGIPIIEFQGTPLQGWSLILKRITDIILSTIALIIFSPLIAVIAILVKIDSKGPVIYKNLRVGNNGNFLTLKFRTMHIEDCTGTIYGGSRAEEFENKLIEEKNIKKGSAVYKIADDPRVTKIGKFLRKTSLDELPQFLNVFYGNMSIVGPRPHQPKEVEKYTSLQKKLLLVKPGITGLAQISGRSDLTFDEESSLDIFYLENWSVWLDFYIVWRTFSVVFYGKGGY
jgi:exopolysaccharide biosynthesis polyprenyl glycosylphosphotransferase